MNRTRWSLLGAAFLMVAMGFAHPVEAHVVAGSALQLFAYETETAPSPIDGDIAPDGQEGKWQSAYVRSIRFANGDGSITKDGTLLVTNDSEYLYVGIGFNSQSASNNNYARIYFDQNHDHVLEGTSAAPGEYFVQIQGEGPSIITNGGWDGSAWTTYTATPAGLEAQAQRHGTGNPSTWNFELKIPLNVPLGANGESYLDVSPQAETGLMIQVFDSSNGVLYWEPTGRDPMDPTTWGEIELGVPNPARDVAGSISLGHDPVIDGNVTDDPEWRHYTSSVRQVLFTNYDGDYVSGRLYTKSNATDVYVGLVLNGRPATAGDRLRIFFDYESATGGDLDYILTDGSENGATLTYTGTGTGTPDDTHFQNTPAWASDAIDGAGAVGHGGTDYEFEFRVPLAGTGATDLQVPLGARLGFNLEFTDNATGDSYWWVAAANSPYQKMRVDAIAFTGLGWLRLQTGAPVIQPVYPRDDDEVSGHFPFMIYATSASGDLGIVSAEFSDDLGVSWQPLERTDESGVWTRVWDTTVLADGTREIRIRAMDTSGLEATAVLQVTVDNSGGASLEVPTVVVNTPTAGDYVSGVTSVDFTAMAAPGRTLLETDIAIDGGAWIAATSPYPWDTQLGNDGSHIFRLRALQSDSLYGYSQPRLVIVDNGPPELEAVQVLYPEGQSAAKAGDFVRVTALIRDARAGLDAASLILSSNAVDGGTHVMVDDGTQGDAVAGDHVYTYGINVTSTATGAVTVSVDAADVLGNAAATVNANVLLDNEAPVHVSTVSADADVIYKNTDIVKITTTWDGPGYVLTADFGSLDSGYVPGAEQVTDNGDSTYTILYPISFENGVADAVAIPVTLRATDQAGNGPVVDATFTVELDNTAPAFSSLDGVEDYYADGDTVTVTAALDDSTYRVWADFSPLDSEYLEGVEMVTRTGNTYTLTYVIDPLNTVEDGAYPIAVQAEDVAGNRSSREASFVLDNTAPELEALSVVYPEGQTAAKTGDVVRIAALVRDARAGLDTLSVILDSNSLDGTTHLMVDDGTQGDVAAGDHVYSFTVGVTSTANDTVQVTVSAADWLGNATGAVATGVILDNIEPSHTTTVSGDADTIYKNTDVVKFITTWDAPGHRLTADFGNLDDNYVTGSEQVVDNEDGSYTITYAISFENGVADATGIAIPITAYDRTGNGPVAYSAFVVELDNTAPAFESVDTAQDNYADGETVILTAVMDDSTYQVWSDLSAIDSNYSEGDEVVTRSGNTYTITYTISPDAQNTTPDGSYDLPVFAEDIAGNRSSLSTSIELDNTAEAVTILRPQNGDLLTGDVVIDVTSADDTRFVRFQVSPDGGVTWYNLEGTQQPFDYTQDDDATNGWRQTWRTAEDALPDGVDYHIRVLAYDEQNPVAHLIGQDEVGGGLVVDNTPPSLMISVTPMPSLEPLRGEVYSEEILLTGSYFDLPDSNRVVGLTIHHRNADGDEVNDSPIHIPADGRVFSRRLRMLPGMNHITVTALDEAGFTTSQTAELTYMAPENVVRIGPEGGVVRSPDGTTLSIPSGALLSPEDISVERVPPDELLPHPNPAVTLLKVAHALSPDGLVFHRAAELVLTYTDSDLDPDQNGTPDWSEDALEVFFWDGFQWVQTEPPVRDPLANTLTLKVNHLATFDLGVVSATGPGAQVYWTRNPFTPLEGSTCVYSMPADGQLSLKIYDMTGQLVRTVLEREPMAMTGSVRWDGQNDFDRYVGSGVYVYIFDFKGNDGSTYTLRKPLGVVK